MFSELVTFFILFLARAGCSRSFPSVEQNSSHSLGILCPQRPDLLPAWPLPAQTWGSKPGGLGKREEAPNASMRDQKTLIQTMPGRKERLQPRARRAFWGLVWFQLACEGSQVQHLPGRKGLAPTSAPNQVPSTQAGRHRHPLLQLRLTGASEDSLQGERGEGREDSGATRPLVAMPLLLPRNLAPGGSPAAAILCPCQLKGGGGTRISGSQACSEGPRPQRVP